MGRLIDADELDYALGASDEDIYFHHMLEDAPTIDAIPLEWIRSLMLDGWPDDSKAAWRVLKAWKEEQEAKT